MDQFVIPKDRSTSICAVRSSISNASVSVSNPSASSIQSATSEPRKRQDRFDKPPSDLGTDKPEQPKIKFPVDSIKRKFNAQWYEKYEWLEYSKEQDAAFCFACRKHGDVALTENTKRFAIYGFYNWKKALGEKDRGLLQHDLSAFYVKAMACWKEKNLRIDTDTSVGLLVSDGVMEKRRYYVKGIAEIIQFLAINELSFRGNYELSEREERGLFNNLFHYTVKKDPKLAAIVKEIPANSTLKSPQIQNSMIGEMAEMVSEFIAADVKTSDTGRYTVMADGTRNKSKEENIAVAVRYVKNGKPKESLLRIK